jgi:hypothetical protein
MDADARFSDPAADLPDAMPERWETAIEDLAQAIALGLDRAQDLADAVNDVLRTRPVVAKAAGAAVVGAVIGSFLASRLMAKPKPKLEVVRETARDVSSTAADQATVVVDQAVAIARAAAERMARRAPSREDLSSGAARLTDAIRDKTSRISPQPASRSTSALSSDSGRAAYAAQLVPLTVALLKNPVVRDLLIRAAVQATSRRKR